MYRKSIEPWPHRTLVEAADLGVHQVEDEPVGRLVVAEHHQEVDQLQEVRRLEHLPCGMRTTFRCER